MRLDSRRDLIWALPCSRDQVGTYHGRRATALSKPSTPPGAVASAQDPETYKQYLAFAESLRSARPPGRDGRRRQDRHQANAACRANSSDAPHHELDGPSGVISRRSGVSDSHRSRFSVCTGGRG